MRLDVWCLAILRRFNRAHGDFIASFVGVVEVIVSDVAITVFNCFDRRRLTVLAILRCFDCPNCGFFAIFISDEEFIVGLAVFTCDCADFRRLTVLTIFAVSALSNRDLRAIGEGDDRIAIRIKGGASNGQISTVLDDIVFTIKGEDIAINITVAISVWCDRWRLAVFRRVDCANRDFFAIFISDIELIAGLAVFACNCANVRGLRVISFLSFWHSDMRTIREGDHRVAGFINDRASDCQRISIFTVSPILTIQNSVINTIQGENVAVSLTFAVSMRLNSRGLTILRCINTTHGYFFASIVGVVEVVANRLAITISDWFDLRCLTILRCFDRSNRSFFASLIGDVELVVGLAIFANNCLHLRCLAGCTIFTIFDCHFVAIREGQRGGAVFVLGVINNRNWLWRCHLTHNDSFALAVDIVEFVASDVTVIVFDFCYLRCLAIGPVEHRARWLSIQREGVARHLARDISDRCYDWCLTILTIVHSLHILRPISVLNGQNVASTRISICRCDISHRNRIAVLRCFKITHFLFIAIGIDDIELVPSRFASLRISDCF